MNTLGQFTSWLNATQNKSFEEKRDALETKYDQYTAAGDVSEADYRSVTGAKLGPMAFTPEGGTFYKDEYVPGSTRVTTFKTFTIGVVTPWQLIKDMHNNGRVKVEKIKFFDNMNEDFTQSANWTREIITSDFITKASSTTATNTWPGTFRDGLALASASHVTTAGTPVTWSNLPTSASLSALTLKEAIKLLCAAPDERGRPQPNVKRVNVIISRYYMFRIDELLKSVLQPDTANNTVNSLKTSDVSIKVIVNPYLGETYKGFQVQNADQKTILRFEKDKPFFRVATDPSTENQINKCIMRYAIDADSAKDVVQNDGA